MLHSFHHTIAAGTSSGNYCLLSPQSFFYSRPSRNPLGRIENLIRHCPFRVKEPQFVTRILGLDHLGIPILCRAVVSFSVLVAYEEEFSGITVAREYPPFEKMPPDVTAFCRDGIYPWRDACKQQGLSKGWCCCILLITPLLQARPPVPHYLLGMPKVPYYLLSLPLWNA